MTAHRSPPGAEIHPSFIQQAIARQLNNRGEVVFRISVKRTPLHHHNVAVRTKLLEKGVIPGIDIILPFADKPVDIDDEMNRKGGSGVHHDAGTAAEERAR
jgi:hypothetical protein